MQRENSLDRLDRQWDLIVVGGGIVGAGIFREAAGKGLSCLLVERHDFAWGTSSRSGKLVHGGLRYLRQGQIRTTFHSVRERQKMLEEYRNLVRPLDFYLPIRKGDRIGSLLTAVGLTVYDAMAGRRNCRKLNRDSLIGQIPELHSDRISGGYLYRDAVTDDARLVLQIVKEGVHLGGTALNYATAQELLRQRNGKVVGIVLQDGISRSVHEIRSRATVNATGAWTDNLRKKIGQNTPIRKLRGSHLILPHDKLPIRAAVAMTHPADKRALYAFPWKGHTLVGTTDLDHQERQNREPRITREEGEYLFQAVHHWFSTAKPGPSDVVATFAGIRPVLHTGKKDPSKESRDHAIWSDNGLITVTGGKLTTFARIARDVLKQAAGYLEYRAHAPSRKVPQDTLWEPSCLTDDNLAADRERPLRELCRSAREEWVVHLEDLLLRRTRIGLLTRNGAFSFLNEIREAVAPSLPWDDIRWQKEIESYKTKWRQAYSPDPLR